MARDTVVLAIVLLGESHSWITYLEDRRDSICICLFLLQSVKFYITDFMNVTGSMFDETLSKSDVMIRCFANLIDVFFFFVSQIRSVIALKFLVHWDI